jgi:DNA integrity scanning protein DisA with diadenylate cyclase activity
MKVLAFNGRYFTAAIGLLLVEIAIAVFVRDDFIRPFFGDVLVVILIYCVIAAFWRIKKKPVAIGICIFAYIVEILQYFNFVQILNLQNNQVASIVLGTSFDWRDILAYAIGTIVNLLIPEKRK